MILRTAKEIKKLDEEAMVKYHQPGLLLMAQAAVGVLDAIKNLGQTYLVVCGPGNNGGDGYALARLLKIIDKDVIIWQPASMPPKDTEAYRMYLAAIDYGVPLLTGDQGFEVKSMDVVVDAIFGISILRPVEGVYEKVINYLNTLEAYKVAVDLPSGLHPDTGMILGVAFKANLTVTFSFGKPGLYKKQGKVLAGVIKIASIGLPISLTKNMPHSIEVTDYDMIGFVPARKYDGHKLTYGRILMVVGSMDMPGAAIMAANSAYQVGVGLVEVLTHKDNMAGIASTIPEAILHGYTDTKDAVVKLLKLLKERTYQAALVGPGLSLDETAEELVKRMLDSSSMPLVIDADAISILSREPQMLYQLSNRCLLTPHYGELSRLLKCTVNDLIQDGETLCKEFIERYPCQLIMKSETSIGFYDKKILLSGFGNPGMATAGSGDVLAGILTGLLGQGLGMEEAIKAGLTIHGMAGDLAAHRFGQVGMKATQMIEALSEVIKERI